MDCLISTSIEVMEELSYCCNFSWSVLNVLNLTMILRWVTFYVCTCMGKVNNYLSDERFMTRSCPWSDWQFCCCWLNQFAWLVDFHKCNISTLCTLLIHFWITEWWMKMIWKDCKPWTHILRLLPGLKKITILKLIEINWFIIISIELYSLLE